jgi:shikimate dehydrogenase
VTSLEPQPTTFPPSARDGVTAPAAPSRLVLLGHPVAHSLSPAFQGAALAAAGLRTRYEAADVPPDALESRLRELAREHAGGNVTVPHKESVASLVDRLAPIAARVGAVNTFWTEGDTLVGHNTDVAGVEAALRALLAEGLGDRTCAVLGAGGSAGAALVALERLGAGEIRVWGRTAGRASALAERVRVGATEHASAVLATRGATLVVNATPIGMHDDAFPVDPTLLAPGTVVLDLVYRRGETAWVRAARARGLVAQDGLRMLVEQGAAAFRCWFGVEPSRDAMWGALEPRG